jgi:CopG family nickel-responsive transcriptional regulator
MSHKNNSAMPVTRFGVSLDENLLVALDEYVRENNFANRSQAIRFLVEKNLVEKKWRCGNVVAGAIALLYGNARHEIRVRSSEIQMEYRDAVLNSQHFILNEQNTLEIIAVKGTSSRLTELSDKLIGIKGILHGKIIMSRTD